MDRRTFLMASTSAALASLTHSGSGWALAPPPVPKARVIVVGGGMGGATMAKYMRLWGDEVAVTLVERNPKYVSSIMSSLVLTAQRDLSSLTFGYEALSRRYGVDVVIDDVVAVDPVRTTVKLASGTALSADRIVMAPGIDFDNVPGLEDDSMPHAWTAGLQTTLLARQLKGMRSNGVVVITIPKAPFRCPPGPYERACLIADWLKAEKPRSKLIVLDANPDIVVEKDNFSRAFLGPHAKIVEYLSGVEVTSVDVGAMSLSTSGGLVRGDVINLIPAQRASALAVATGLVSGSDGRFAPVDVLSYASVAAPSIHVIGDSSATTQPKAGHIANQEAKVCADALARLFSGGQPDPSPVTNSACYSTITRTEASWLTAVFQYDAAAKVMTPVAQSFAASDGWTPKYFKEMGKWFDGLMADTFS
ncbi:FAD-dependent oxidoreductase [Hyphomicrobium sp. DMF-1]|uniref:FAD-dependent oxidoreductase n=1 Tax=Hyphomicrobium sp. DMF-1 TaxID=3019544 RepID=UPI002FDC438D